MAADGSKIVDVNRGCYLTFAAIYDCPVPVISAVHGYCIGGGIGISGDGSPLRAGNHQPLFHVEHAVRGTDSQPLNLWRIVHLTAERDDALIERQLTDTGAAEWLRRFIAIYVEADLGIKLSVRGS